MCVIRKIRFTNRSADSMSPAVGEYDTSQLLMFYHGEICNPEGKSIAQLHRLNDFVLETNHSYIQWLFPLTERSMYNGTAPCITKEQTDTLKVDTVFLKNLQKSFYMMMRHYGIKESSNGYFYIYNIKRAKCYWLKSNDHNQLRITRILNCLDIFGMEYLSNKLRRLLSSAYSEYGRINSETLYYWKLYEQDK